MEKVERGVEADQNMMARPRERCFATIPDDNIYIRRKTNNIGAR